MIDFKEIPDPEIWELFSRDFFIELGFTIESPPDRGPDGGKDFIIKEAVQGKLSHYPFRWLVSCKNNIISGKSVSEKDEIDIRERCESYNADGFIGFYSTIISSGLNERLQRLRNNNKLQDYKIFDHKLIESYLHKYGFSKLIIRYFPVSYNKIRPLHKIFDELYELKCDSCGKNLLENIYEEHYTANICYIENSKNRQTIYEDCYFACKGSCDDELNSRAIKNGYMTGWTDLTDLIKPNFFLKHILATVSQLNSQQYLYTKKAIKKERLLLMAIAQKVFHEVTDKERERFNELMSFGIF